MKAIILAAGEGMRMRPLTNNTPKPLLKIGDKTLLEQIVSRLPKKVDEIVLAIGYLGEQIKDYCGENFLGRKVRYVWQGEKRGTFSALKDCELLIKPGEKFLMLYADDIHGEADIKECLKYDYALTITEVEDPKKFGVVKLNNNNSVAEIVEKPEKPASNLVSTGVMLLDTEIFKYEIEPRANGEYCLADAVEKMIEDSYQFFAVKSNLWLPIGYPEDLVKAEKILQERGEI